MKLKYLVSIKYSKVSPEKCCPTGNMHFSCLSPYVTDEFVLVSFKQVKRKLREVDEAYIGGVSISAYNWNMSKKLRTVTICIGNVIRRNRIVKLGNDELKEMLQEYPEKENWIIDRKGNFFSPEYEPSSDLLVISLNAYLYGNYKNPFVDLELQPEDNWLP